MHPAQNIWIGVTIYKTIFEFGLHFGLFILAIVIRIELSDVANVNTLFYVSPYSISFILNLEILDRIWQYTNLFLLPILEHCCTIALMPVWKRKAIFNVTHYRTRHWFSLQISWMVQNDIYFEIYIYSHKKIRTKWVSRPNLWPFYLQ